MKTKIEVKANFNPITRQKANSSAEQINSVLEGYRILTRANSSSGTHSWDFHGRDGSHGHYSFPFFSLKQLDRKA